MPTYSDALADYVKRTFAAEDEVLVRIREGIQARGLPTITVRPEEGRFLQFLVAACGARQALEIGTLGGYSGVWIARGLPPGGRLITLEMDPERAAVAQEHFRMAGLRDRVEVHTGDALDLLPRLSEEGPFDFVFIDADKGSYPAYLTWSLSNLSPGGVLAAHNAFRHGAVVDPSATDPDTRAMRQFNAQLAQHPRLISIVHPAGDGLAIATLRR